MRFDLSLHQILLSEQLIQLLPLMLDCLIEKGRPSVDFFWIEFMIDTPLSKDEYHHLLFPVIVFNDFLFQFFFIHINTPRILVVPSLLSETREKEKRKNQV